MHPDVATYTYLESPLGRLLVVCSAGRLACISFQNGQRPVVPDPTWHFEEGARWEVLRQLRAYFEGTLQTFDVPLLLRGTPFQHEVWRALQDIPYGETVSYGALAQRIGRPKAVRAVGAANGKNPIPIIVPCHRVIGNDGALTGYAGGVSIKKALLAHERSRHRPVGTQLSLMG